MIFLILSYADSSERTQNLRVAQWFQPHRFSGKRDGASELEGRFTA